MTTVIAARRLSKRYGDVRAVDGVSLTVDAGEIYALLGLNGAGKSTMIRMLLGMVRPTSGVATLFDSDVHPGTRRPWSRVGYLVETPTAYPELTVRENLHVASRLRKLRDHRRIDDVLDRLGLRAYADRRARTLSLGNTQRLGLAKALLHQPDLLILDEPVNGLDPAGVVEIRTLLHDLAAVEGVTILVSSHILAEIARLATRIGVLHRGHLLADWHTSDLQASDRRLLISTRDNHRARAVLEAAGMTVVETAPDSLALHDERAVAHPDDIATTLVNAGCPPTRLLVAEDSLENRFLRIVGNDPPADGTHDRATDG